MLSHSCFEKVQLTIFREPNCALLSQVRGALAKCCAHIEGASEHQPRILYFVRSVAQCRAVVIGILVRSISQLRDMSLKKHTIDLKLYLNE